MSGRLLPLAIRLSKRHSVHFCKNRFTGTPAFIRSLSTTEKSDFPDTLNRVGQPIQFPNESPGCNYEFNWCLNGDGVTPLRRSAFRISKPLDLKLAGLAVPEKMPLKVTAADASKIPEAGSPELSFEIFDEVSQRTRDLLSLSDHLYCPEGHVPGTRAPVRVITNSATLAPNILAYLERAPRKDPPVPLPITVYALEGTQESFAGYAIEEIEVTIPSNEPDPGWISEGKHEKSHERPTEPKSVASVVVVGQKVDITIVVAGMELCQKALAADELERKAKKDAAQQAK